VLDLDIWSYTTVVADVVVPFDPVISDPESVALEWVPVDEVSDRPLHPGFGAAWPLLRELLPVRPVVVVDAANVVGSVPDGWWKDRAGAASRLRDRLSGLAVPAAEFEIDGSVWFPEVALVVEGRARGIDGSSAGGAADGEVAESDGIMAPEPAVVRADGAGDDEIVAETSRRAGASQHVLVVTSDRELRGRVQSAGATQVRSSGWLLDVLDA
jgi:hypothetical protein